MEVLWWRKTGRPLVLRLMSSVLRGAPGGRVDCKHVAARHRWAIFAGDRELPCAPVNVEAAHSLLCPEPGAPSFEFFVSSPMRCFPCEGWD